VQDRRKGSNIALTTKIAKLQTKLDKQAVAFATQAKSVINPSSEINPNGGKSCGKKDRPYTVAEWHLTKKEDTVTFNLQNVSLVHWRSL
jgi:hypothetical protein